MRHNIRLGRGFRYKVSVSQGYVTLLALKCNNMCMKFCQSRMLTPASLSRDFTEASLDWQESLMPTC